MIRNLTKLTGHDVNQEYALKSLSKQVVVARNSGVAAAITELRALVLLRGCKFICNVHYAFQDSTHLYMVDI
jgi:hypothetical protein